MPAPFFESRQHPHCTMNRFGVVFVPNGHADGARCWGRSFDRVPLAPGRLDLRHEVEMEAIESGYGYTTRPDGERVYTKPKALKETTHR